MKYLSLCSGIEAATVAWHPLGWEAVAYSEIERFPSEVLAHHYPQTPNVGDMTKFKEWNLEANVDLLVGGTPCQSFSVAGLRKGLDDPRGNLMLTYLAIADKYRPRWLVWENVPGVLSSNEGKDFGTFLGAMGELGYGFAYRVLDAQYFGVAQRRRRVFVVGCLGDWRSAAAVLFERYSLSGHPAPSREKRQKVASTVTNGPPFSRTGNERVEAEAIVTASRMVAFGEYVDDGTASAMKARDYKDATDLVAQPIPIHDQATRFAGKRGDKQDGKGNGLGIGQPGDPAPTLTKGDKHAVAQPIGTDLYNGAITGDIAVPLTHRSDGTGTGPTVMQSMAVRRLTPVECERLQGFPDNYTNIKEKCPDGPRYKALGNSMAVPVMAWIGKRIQMVENLNV